MINLMSMTVHSKYDTVHSRAYDKCHKICYTLDNKRAKITVMGRKRGANVWIYFHLLNGYLVQTH